METQQAANTEPQPTRTRERRTAYYIVSEVARFETKAKLEGHLTKNGGIPAGHSIMKGMPITADTTQVFRIN